MRPTRVRRGGTALEFAMISPVFLALIFGTLEWGWYLQQETSVVYGIRQAALLGSIQSRQDDPVARTRRRLEDFLTEEGYDLSRTRADVSLDTNAFGTTLNIDVQLRHEPLFGLVPTPEVMRLHHTTQMLN